MGISAALRCCRGIRRIRRKFPCTSTFLNTGVHFAYFRPIRLVRFPALTHLKIALDMPLDIIATLPTISEITNRNTIQEIIYMIETPRLLDGEPQAAAEQSSTWPTFDAGITALPLPNLERIEIMFLEDPDDYLDLDHSGAERATPQHLDAASFPLLSERKLLFLTTQYYQ
ncbi:hypothetical protein B0H17DRAFT_1153201 [Mycena rosella]|uniref:Uncharacterized protein n=1 Tax=Mycena rosella TaxID=1033263 RepID=A0AAD7B8V3_MYCRO|nr:hypothetical protein B0H17DRAFT_1153201 [Mycena rosella]